MSRAIFEAEQDGNSVVIWEAGTGHRILYPSYEHAERAYNWLCEKATAFHTAKRELEVAVAEVYGEPCTPYEVIRRFISIATKYGYPVQENSLSREPKEFW